MQSTYEIILYWSRDDEAFITEVPDLPGCMADGETYQDALRTTEYPRNTQKRMLTTDYADYAD